MINQTVEVRNDVAVSHSFRIANYTKRILIEAGPKLLDKMIQCSKIWPKFRNGVMSIPMMMKYTNIVNGIM